MKTNMKEIRQHISEILSQTSNNFEFSEINFYLKTALNKIEEKEKREIRKNKNQNLQTSNSLQNISPVNQKQAKALLNKIDELIAFEQNKLSSQIGRAHV